MSTHESRDHWQEWIKKQLQEVEVLPRKEYMEESMQVLLAALHEERRKVRFRKRIRRMLEGLAVAVAAVAIFYVAPQLNSLMRDDGSAALDQGPAGQSGEIGMMGESDDAKIQKSRAAETVENEQFRVLLPTPSPLKVGTEFEVTGEVKQAAEINSQRRLRYEVEDGHDILASGTWQADGEGRGWQPFVLKVKLEQKPTSPNGLLILYAEQAGQRSNELTIPLQFVEQQQGSPDSTVKNDASAPLPPAEEGYSAQPVRVVDQRGEDQEFAAYFQSLQKAVKERDVSALKKAMSPEIFLSFGGQKGYKDLEEMWDLKTNPQASPIWSELEKALKYGAKKEGDYFRAPAVEWPANTDEYRVRAIVGSHVNVRSAPSMDGKVIEQVSNLLVRMPKDLTKYDQPGWKAVILPSGKPGFVAEEYVVEPLGYRAVFGKVDGKWTMITWVAGD